MESEKRVLTQIVAEKAEVMTEQMLFVNGLVEGNPGCEIVPSRVAELLGMSVRTCISLLNQHPLAVRVTEKNKTVRFISVAPELSLSTQEGAEGIDKDFDSLGKQAREDYYDLIEKRSLMSKRHFKVTRKF